MMAVCLMVLTFAGSQGSNSANAEEITASFLADLEVQEGYHHYHGRHCSRQYLYEAHEEYNECICYCHHHHCKWFCEI